MDLLIDMFCKYFAEDAPFPLAMTNQVLREEISETLESIAVKDKKKQGQHDDNDDNDLMLSVVDLLLQARMDHKIWKGGLDLAYKHFVSLRPTNSLTAVLMSIL